MNPHETELEKILDSLGVVETLELLAQICSSKADHIWSTYQDAILEESWNRAAGGFLHISAKLKGL